MTPEEYKAKKERRVERLKASAGNHTAKSSEAFNRARGAIAMIPPGQPILVDHYSAKRHRGDLSRHDAQMRKSIEEDKIAAEQARRAEAAENNTAISSDDPEAIQKIEARIVDLEAYHKMILAGNKAIKKAGTDKAQAQAALEAIGFGPNAISSALMQLHSGRFWGFHATNSAADIRRNKQRLEDLKKRAAAPPREPLIIGKVTITWNADANRVQIVFPGKPAETIRDLLKSYAFKWAPTDGVWQRQLCEAAWRCAKDVAEKCQ